MYFKQYLGPISTYSNSQVLYRFAYYKKNNYHAKLSDFKSISCILSSTETLLIRFVLGGATGAKCEKLLLTVTLVSFVGSLVVVSTGDFFTQTLSCLPT